MKRCTKCETEKPNESFWRDGRTSDGLKCWCKQCMADTARRRRDEAWKRSAAERQQFCLLCSEPLEIRRGPGRPRRFCSSACREKYRYSGGQPAAVAPPVSPAVPAAWINDLMNAASIEVGRWRHRAACLEAPVEMFFPVASIEGAGPAKYGRDAVADALDVCADCPVSYECAVSAVQERDRFSVRGGLVPTERPWIPPSPARPARCGTEAGYKDHRRHGEDACAQCRDANARAKWGRIQLVS